MWKLIEDHGHLLEEAANSTPYAHTGHHQYPPMGNQHGPREQAANSIPMNLMAAISSTWLGESASHGSEKSHVWRSPSHTPLPP